MTDWHFASAYEAIADTIGDKPALICGDVVRSWHEYDDRSARIATVLCEAGLGAGSKVGIYLHNGNEYLEAHHGVMKFRGCPINVNFRYQEEELVYLLSNADAEAVVFQATYADRVDAIRDRLDQVKCFLQVDDGSGKPIIGGGLDYETAIAVAEPMSRIERSADDLYMFYTGGTTGMPKGVMYKCGDLCKVLTESGAIAGATVPEDIDHLKEIVALAAKDNALPVSLVCCPLMHATGMWGGAKFIHLRGGAVITVNSLGLEPDQLWKLTEEHRVSVITIVGDAFARPLLDALNAAKENGTPYDLSSVELMQSSGVMWSKEVKDGLLAHQDMLLVDTMGSTEGGMGATISSRESSPPTAKFELGENVKVFTDDDREVLAGSNEIGKVGTQSAMLGYYKDPDKTARTIRNINGKRWVFPGDFATVEADGSINLLGRGSMCINTAGEKVFAEEVEEALKSHESVVDCLVVGVPDERFGQKVAAVVSLVTEGAEEADLMEHCHKRMARYKAPKHILFVDHVQRATNGKADYSWAKETVRSLLGSPGI